VHDSMQTCAAVQVASEFAGGVHSADVQQPPRGTHVASGHALYPS
jgi:hypothetical protein